MSSTARSEELYVGGDGVASSSHFRLEPRVGRVTIDVTPKSAPRVPAGTVLTVVGALGVLGGSLVWVGEAVAEGTGGSAAPKIAGGVVGAGAALLAAGIPLLVTGRTTYTFGKPDVAFRF